MAALGLCVNAKAAVPDAAECAALGLGAGKWARTAIQGSLTLLDGMLARLPADINVMVTLNNEAAEVKSDWSGWERACQIIAAKYAGRVKVVGCANELDIFYHQGDRSVSPLFAANLARRAAPILRPAGIKIALSSMASAIWPEYLREMAHLAGSFADLADLHPYGQRAAGFPSGWGFGELGTVIHVAGDMSGLPVILSEYGIKVGDAGGEQGQAEYVRRSAELLKALPASRFPFACYFAWRDDIGAPHEQGEQAFGLRRLDGSPRPAWQAFVEADGGPANHPPAERHAEYVLGFRKWWNVEPDLLGAPLKNERTVAPKWQIQPTENGVLSWVAGKGHAFVQHDGRVFRWQEDWPSSREVPE